MDMLRVHVIPINLKGVIMVNPRKPRSVFLKVSWAE